MPTIIQGPNRQKPIALAARATITSVREKTAAAKRPQPTARKALPVRTPGCNPTRATPPVHRTAPSQRWGETPSGKNTAPSRAVMTTLVPRIGVATETSPPERARKVPICPRKKRTEQAGAASQTQTGKPAGGIFAQNKIGNEQAAMARLQVTRACRGECPASIDRLSSSAPIA